MGSLVGAAWAAGHTIESMLQHGLNVRRKHVFQVAHTDMAMRRMRAPAIYRPEPLLQLIENFVGDKTFDDLERRLIVNTVDINSGMQVLWGQPGLRDVRVADAVFASCALPGLFPPRQLRGRYYCDGAVLRNLPVRATSLAEEMPVIAVDVGSSSVLRADVENSGFAAAYARGLEIVMQTMTEESLRGWEKPALLLVHPRVEHVQTRELIDEGYRATKAALEFFGGPLPANARGIYPRRRVHIRIAEDRCIGCEACVLRAPHVFALGDNGKALVLEPEQSWSPLDGDYVRNCPTYAISARLADGTSIG
jgi:NTE family protein